MSRFASPPLLALFSLAALAAGCAQPSVDIAPREGDFALIEIQLQG